MRKKIIIIIIAVVCVLTLSFSALALINKGPREEPANKGEFVPNQGKSQLVQMITESDKYNTPYENLTEYSYDRFMMYLRQRRPSSSDRRVFLLLSSGMMTFHTFNIYCPIEKVTVINDECIYAEYKLNKDGELLHVIVVFDRMTYKTPEGEYLEEWNHYGEVHLVYPELSHEQFLELKGTRKAIKDIPFAFDMMDSPKVSAPPFLFEETLLLKDGIVIVNCETESYQSEEADIVDVNFIPYGQSDARYPGNSFIVNQFTPNFNTMILPDQGKGEMVQKIKTTNDYKTSYKKLTAYPYDAFMSQVQQRRPSSSDRRILFALSSGMGSMYSFDARFPIEKLRIINDDCIYAEYILKTGGELLNTIVVFERTIYKTEDGIERELWHNFGEVYPIYPKVRSNQFLELKGTRKAVKDLPFEFDVNNTPCTVGSVEGYPFRFEETIMLKDGIVILDCMQDSLYSKEVYIADVNFIPYGQSDERYPGNSFIVNQYTPKLNMY